MKIFDIEYPFAQNTPSLNFRNTLYQLYEPIKILRYTTRKWVISKDKYPWKYSKPLKKTHFRMGHAVDPRRINSYRKCRISNESSKKKIISEDIAVENGIKSPRK